MEAIPEVYGTNLMHVCLFQSAKPAKILSWSGTVGWIVITRIDGGGFDYELDDEGHKFGHKANENERKQYTINKP